MSISAFSKTRLPLEFRQVLSCESPAVFLHFPLEEKGPWGPFYQLRQVLGKGSHLVLQILLKALVNVTEVSCTVKLYCYAVLKNNLHYPDTLNEVDYLGEK